VVHGLEMTGGLGLSLARGDTRRRELAAELSVAQGGPDGEIARRLPSAFDESPPLGPLAFTVESLQHEADAPPGAREAFVETRRELLGARRGEPGRLELQTGRPRAARRDGELPIEDRELFEQVPLGGSRGGQAMGESIGLTAQALGLEPGRPFLLVQDARARQLRRRPARLRARRQREQREPDKAGERPSKGTVPESRAVNGRDSPA